MLAELVVMLIILATVVFAYLKGSVVKTFMLLVNTLVAAAIAFAYFEILGRLIIGYNMLVDWAFAVALILIFTVALGILNTIGGKLLPTELYFGDFADRIIRSLLAVFAGLGIAGIILTAGAMMPIGTKWPYERFSNTVNNPPEPEKTLILNADGFITGISSWLSQGSMSGKKSFAVFHPDFLNEIYLNRIGCDSDNPAVGGESSISVEAAWTPQAELVSATDNLPIGDSSRGKAIVLRVRTDTTFSMSQVRLICKESNSADNLKGSGEVIWPIGYLTSSNAVDRKNLSEKIKLKRLDLVFYIPADTVPIMLQYKLNAVAPIGRLASGENIPSPL
jgi:hypothetical protein